MSAKKIESVVEETESKEVNNVEEAAVEETVAPETTKTEEIAKEEPIVEDEVIIDEKDVIPEEEAKKIAEKLSKILLKIPVKAGENGKIFGGVSAKEVSDLLKEEYKIEVDKKKIELKETIKTLGVRTLTIKLYEGVIGNLKIDVISK